MSLNNSQYDTLIRQYNARQFHNQHLLDERIQEVYGKCPRLTEIDNEISSISVASAKQLLSDDGAEDSSVLSSLKEQLAALRREKQNLIASLGYPADYLEPVYTCKDCKDTGYIGNERCHCFVQAAIDLVYTQSNVKDILAKENFSNFSYAYYSKEQINPTTGLSAYDTVKKAVADCKSFIEHFDTSFENLFFYGATGVGKTFLSNCVAKELLDKGHSVIYFTAFQLFDIFEKNTFHRETDEDIIAAHQNIFDCDLLIIDDLGTELPNSFTISQLFLCLNERILRKKSTIISTNLTLNQIAEIYSERTFSRISSNYVMLKLFGDDIRIQKKFR